MVLKFKANASLVNKAYKRMTLLPKREPLSMYSSALPAFSQEFCRQTGQRPYYQRVQQDAV